MRVRTRAILLAAATLFPIAAGAQGVIVQSSSDVKFFGALGTMVGIASRFGGGGDMHDISSTTTVSGHKLRIENADAATIIDVDGGRMTQVDHKRKTYRSMTFAEMAAAMQSAAQQMKQGADKQAAQQAKDPNAPKGEVNFKYSVAVDRPGQHEKIAGYDAERVFLTVTMEAEAKPEGEKAEQVGSLVFLFDQWMSKDAPKSRRSRSSKRPTRPSSDRPFVRRWKHFRRLSKPIHRSKPASKRRGRNYRKCRV